MPVVPFPDGSVLMLSETLSPLEPDLFICSLKFRELERALVDDGQNVCVILYS